MTGRTTLLGYRRGGFVDLRFWEGMEVERMVGVVGMRQPGCFAILKIGGTSWRCRFIFIPMLVPVSGNFSSHLISAKRHCNFFFSRVQWSSSTLQSRRGPWYNAVLEVRCDGAVRWCGGTVCGAVCGAVRGTVCGAVWFWGAVRWCGTWYGVWQRYDGAVRGHGGFGLVLRYGIRWYGMVVWWIGSRARWPGEAAQ